MDCVFKTRRCFQETAGFIFTKSLCVRRSHSSIYVHFTNAPRRAEKRRTASINYSGWEEQEEPQLGDKFYSMARRKDNLNALRNPQLVKYTFEDHYYLPMYMPTYASYEQRQIVPMAQECLEQR